MEQTMNLYLWYDGEGNDLIDSHHPHFSETPVFAGCGVRAVGTNECVSTNSMEKNGYEECKSILTNIGIQENTTAGEGAK